MYIDIPMNADMVAKTGRSRKIIAEGPKSITAVWICRSERSSFLLVGVHQILKLECGRRGEVEARYIRREQPRAHE